VAVEGGSGPSGSSLRCDEWWSSLQCRTKNLSETECRERAEALTEWLKNPANLRALQKHREWLETRVIAYGEVSPAIRLTSRDRPMAPGDRLAAFAKLQLSPSMFRRYVLPAIADIQHEHTEALEAGRLWHARWIALSGHLLVIPGWIYALLAERLGALLRRGRWR
jgi:hypothetical protein